MLRFDGKVAVITGAGGGLGRSHALLLGARGAKVVVNDLGGSAFGEGRSSSAADKVVEEIRAAGGEAVASYDSVEDGDKIVQCALDCFKRIDVVVNNAGILRDKSFAKMTREDWELVYRVHVNGSFRVTHAAWPHLREQQYGRIIMTASAAGIYGNFGQANYSMAKLGLTGFANTLALEGRGKNVNVNTIAPIAGSRLTETVLPEELIDELKPEYVSPLVAWLCHEDCQDSGGLYEVGGGFFAKLRWERTAGKTYRRGRSITVEDVQHDWDTITSFDETTHPTDAMNAMGPVLDNVRREPSKGGNQYIDVDAALGYQFEDTRWSYDEKDLALYALGVGAASDPYSDELRYVYELHSDGFSPLPTFGVIPAVNSFIALAREGKLAPGLSFGFDRILHGEQYTELKRPLPPKAQLTQRSQVKQIYDKGKNAVVDIETKSYDENGELLIVNDLIIVARGCGGWGGERGPSVEENVPPARKPDAVVEERISPNQALLYRLTGDVNPLHADPMFAKAVGFEKPILHGLCTFGYAGRHAIKSFADGDTRYFKSIKVRMAASVYPGETLVTEMWKESDGKIVLQCKVKERGEVVIKNAAVELYAEIPKPKPKAAVVEAKPGAPAAAGSKAVFAAIADHVKAHGELVGKVGTVFQFGLTTPDSVWTLDLKNGSGSVVEGKAGKPDCTLELSDADFMGMVRGELDPQKLFMNGKLKISGNIMASQKLSFLQKVKMSPATPSPAPDARGTSVVFRAIGDYVAQHPELVAKVATVFQFKLSDPESVWTIDLKRGAVGAGETQPPECTLALSDADFLAMSKGQADPQKMFLEGKLKITGNVMASQKLSFLKDVQQAKAPAPPASRAPAFFESLARSLEPGRPGRIHFKVTEPSSEWLVDLKSGTIERGGGQADAVLTLSEETLLALAGGAQAGDLFQRGKLRVEGDLQVARRLAFLAA